MADIRYRIQQAHGGEIREIPDGAWPFFQNQGYVILSTIGAPPAYALPALPVVHGDDANALRPMTIQPVVWYGSVEPVNLDVDLGDEWVTSGTLDDAGVAGLVGNGASATAVALRAAFGAPSAVVRGTGVGATDRAAINAAIASMTTAGKVSGRLLLQGNIALDQAVTIDGGYASNTQSLTGAGPERFILDAADAVITPAADVGAALTIKGFYGPVVNLRFRGGGASRTVTDASMTASSGVITSATAAFTSADVGKYVRVEGAGNLGHAPYVARITGITSATQATTDGTAATTVSAASLTVQDIALHLENLTNVDLSLWAANFAGLGLHLDALGSTARYVTQSTFRKVYTLSCGQAISLKGTQGGLGAFLDVWDDNNVRGSVIDTSADTTFLHYENYSPATQTVGVLFSNCSNIYISEISLGDRPSEALLKIVSPGFDFGHIDKVRVGGQPGVTAGNGVTDGLKLVEVASIDIGEVVSLRCANGVRIMGGGPNSISIKRHLSQTSDTTSLRIEPGPSTAAPIVDAGVHHRFNVNPVILGALTGGTVKIHGHMDSSIFQGGAGGKYSVASTSTGVLDITGLTQDTRSGLAGVTNHTGVLRSPDVLAANTQAGSYTLSQFDRGKVVEINSASAVNVTVPPNASAPFPVGTVIEVQQYGAGQVTIAPGAGVTLVSNLARTKTAGQFATIRLRKRATDEWVLSGDLA